MIRPFTIAAFLMAGASGLYLYQSKHEVQLLDRTIERTVRETNALRAQSRLLVTEWEMLNNTDRLRQFSDTYLSLKSISPAQFTSLADLDNRLPAPQPEVHGDDAPKLVPIATDADTGETTEPATVDEVIPVPPIPVAPPAALVASVVRQNEARTPERVPASRPAVAEYQPRPVADARPPEPRQTDPRLTEQRQAEQRRAERRPAEQRPAEPGQADQRMARVADARVDVRVPVAAPPKPIVLALPRPAPVMPTAATPFSVAPAPPHPAMIAAAAPYGRSLLGIARGPVPPAPRPLPFNATDNSN